MAFSKDFLQNLAAGLYGGMRQTDKQDMLRKQQEQDLYKTLALAAMQDQRMQKQIGAEREMLDERLRSYEKQLQEKLNAQRELEKKRLEAQWEMFNKKLEAAKRPTGGSSGIPKELDSLIKARAKIYEQFLRSFYPDNSGMVDPDRIMYFKQQLDRYNQQLQPFGVPTITVDDNFLNKFLGVTKPMTYESLTQNNAMSPDLAEMVLQHKRRAMMPQTQPQPMPQTTIKAQQDGRQQLQQPAFQEPNEPTIGQIALGFDKKRNLNVRTVLTPKGYVAIDEPLHGSREQEERLKRAGTITITDTSPIGTIKVGRDKRKYIKTANGWVMYQENQIDPNKEIRIF